MGPRFSQVSVAGDGTGDLGELPFYPPQNVTSPGFDENVSPGGTVTLDNVPTDANVDLFLVNGEDFVWWIIGGSTSSVVVPQLPSGANVLVGEDVRFRPRYCELGVVAGENVCARLSFGAAFGAAP